MKLKEVRESALQLPLRSRAKLAGELIRSLDQNIQGPERTEKEWKEEIARRISDLESGKDPGMSGEDFLKWIYRGTNEHPSRKRRAARL